MIYLPLIFYKKVSLSRIFYEIPHIYILPILMPLPFDFSPLSQQEILPWPPHILWEGGSRSWVSLRALLWSAFLMGAVHYFLEGL